MQSDRVDRKVIPVLFLLFMPLPLGGPFKNSNKVSTIAKYIYIFFLVK